MQTLISEMVSVFSFQLVLLRVSRDDRVVKNSLLFRNSPPLPLLSVEALVEKVVKRWLSQNSLVYVQKARAADSAYPSPVSHVLQDFVSRKMGAPGMEMGCHRTGGLLLAVGASPHTGWVFPPLRIQVVICCNCGVQYLQLKTGSYRSAREDESPAAKLLQPE